MGDIHQPVKNHREVFFRPFSGRTGLLVYDSVRSGTSLLNKMVQPAGLFPTTRKNKRKDDPVYSIIGTGYPYPPYGRGISRMGFIVGRLVAINSLEDNVYRTSPM